MWPPWKDVALQFWAKVSWSKWVMSKWVMIAPHILGWPMCVPSTLCSRTTKGVNDQIVRTLKNDLEHLTRYFCEVEKFSNSDIPSMNQHCCCGCAHCNTGMHFIGKNTQEKGWSKRGCGVFSRAQERLPSPVLLYSVEGLYSLFKINENHVQSY